MSDHQVNQAATTNSGVAREPQQINVVDDSTLQAVLNSMSEVEMNAFIEELNKTGKAYLPAIGQTVELLSVPASTEISATTVNQPTAEILLQELTSMTQQPLTELVPVQMEPRPVVSAPRQGNTAVKSTITSNAAMTNNNAAVRKPIQQQTMQDERMFFGRPTTIGQGQYQNRTGLMSMNKQQTHLNQSTHIQAQQQIHHQQHQQHQHHQQQHQQQQQQQQQQQHQQQHQQQQLQQQHQHHHQQPQQRRPISWFSNRSRRHSSDEEDDSDRDSSPPMSGNESLGPTRRSSRVPKPKQDADFVTFPLLDRDENGNPIAPTPSMPLNKAEDDEDDIPYRLMDYPRPQQQQQNSSNQSLGSGPGRKPRPTAEIRSATNANKKPARWPDDELYHVKSTIPLIMPQQVTNPSIMRNKMTLCKPIVSEREVEAKPTRFTIATQTEMENMIPDVPLITMPVPLYLPSPTPSYRLFKPRAVPIPVPFFVPVMVPVPRKAYKNIRDYLQTQRDLLPDDPFQAALILHAESLVRAENRPIETNATSQESVIMMDITRDDAFVNMVQTIETIPELDFEAHYIDPIGSTDPEIQKLLRMLPDASDRLKWVYGIEAFQRWGKQRNQPILNAPPEEAELAQQYLVKTDLLSYVNGDELQRVLDAFIQEVRRPNGEPYSAESIYYLCLGIQYYLKLNNRSIDLFDPRYIEFNATLNAILLTHRARVSPDGQSFISVIDEELLYDVHQLGITSPWAILTTLVYTNSKYFNLKTVESHMTISFANFGKYSQWVRLSQASAQGQQMNYLRFYAHNPDLKSLANAPTVYEITERIGDQIHCPIKQYDFYISKCPEEIRGTADVFYLRPLTEEIHENSIWFSTECLSPTIIDQILNRLKLLPDFYQQTKPVETGSTGNSSVPVTSTTGT